MYVEHCQLLGGFGEDETATKLIQQYADSVSNWTLYEFAVKCMVKYNMRTKQKEMYKQLFHKKKKGHVNYVTVISTDFLRIF